MILVHLPSQLPKYSLQQNEEIEIHRIGSAGSSDKSDKEFWLIDFNKPKPINRKTNTSQFWKKVIPAR